MRLSRLALPLLLTGALVAGCGGGSSKQTSPSTGQTQPSQQPQLSPVAAVQGASDATSKAGSSKFALSSVAKFGANEVTISGDGAIDYAKRTGQLTLKLAQGAQRGATIEERFLGDTLYVSAPQQPGTFYKLALKDLVGTSLASSADPTAGFQVLKGASSDVTEVGKEKVRDADTTHYKGTYDAQAALAKVSGVSKQLLQSSLQGSDLSKVPFDAYLDSQGRLRKLVQQLTVHPKAAKGMAVQTTTTLEAFDFGTPVTASAPPAAQIKDGAPLVKALRGAVASSG